MNLKNRILAVSILCTLAGCAAAGASDPETSKTDRPSGAAQTEKAALIRGNVVAIFHVESAGDCRPLGMPLTSYLTNAFGPETLVEDDAILAPMTADSCLHQQLLAAPADAWATLAHGPICGGADALVCNSLEKRQCSAEQLMNWAEERDHPVASNSSIFEFHFVMAPQEQPARMALYRRAQQEVDTLLDETTQVMENAASLGDCPNQTRAGLADMLLNAHDMDQQLDDILSSSADDGV